MNLRADNNPPPTGQSAPQSPVPIPVQDRHWYLIVYRDPLTPSTENGPYGTVPAVYDGPEAHDGKYPQRVFFKRFRTLYQGNARSVFVEVSAKGLVQCNYTDGVAKPKVEDLHSMIEVTDGWVWTGVARENPESSSPDNWLKFLKAARENDNFGPGSVEGYREAKEYEYGIKASDRYSVGLGQLEIDKLTGKVTFAPEQVTPKAGTGAYEEFGLLDGVDYSLRSFGVVKPQILVEAHSACGEEAKIKWNFGGDGEGKGAKLVGGMEWENQKQSVFGYLQWQIRRAYRMLGTDGQPTGDIIIDGEAAPQNKVEYIAPPGQQQP